MSGEAPSRMMPAPLVPIPCVSVTAGPYECPLCLTKFKNRELLDRHRKRKKICAYICDWCQNRYTNRRTLERHMKSCPYHPSVAPAPIAPAPIAPAPAKHRLIPQRDLRLDLLRLKEQVKKELKEELSRPSSLTINNIQNNLTIINCIGGKDGYGELVDRHGIIKAHQIIRESLHAQEHGDASLFTQIHSDVEGQVPIQLIDPVTQTLLYRDQHEEIREDHGGREIKEHIKSSLQDCYASYGSVKLVAALREAIPKERHPKIFDRFPVTSRRADELAQSRSSESITEFMDDPMASLQTVQARACQLGQQTYRQKVLNELIESLPEISENLKSIAEERRKPIEEDPVAPEPELHPHQPLPVFLPPTIQPPRMLRPIIPIPKVPPPSSYTF